MEISSTSWDSSSWQSLESQSGSLSMRTGTGGALALWPVWGGRGVCVCVRGTVNSLLLPGESWGNCRRDDFRSRLSKWSQWTREVVGCVSDAILVDNRTVDKRYTTISCLIIKRHERVYYQGIDLIYTGRKNIKYWCLHNNLSSALRL